VWLLSKPESELSNSNHKMMNIIIFLNHFNGYVTIFIIMFMVLFVVDEIKRKRGHGGDTIFSDDVETCEAVLCYEFRQGGVF
jgi:hypothetical protein